MVGLGRTHGVTYSVPTHTMAWYTFRKVGSLSLPVKGLRQVCGCTTPLTLTTASDVNVQIVLQLLVTCMETGEVETVCPITP